MMKKKKSGQVPALLLLEPIYIMLQIAVAVNYLHESWMMHCDLKVSNVLLNIVEDQNAYFSLSSVQVKLQHCCLSKLKLHSLGYNHTVGGYKPGGGHLRYLMMRRTETRTQNHQVCIALQLFSLRYSMGKSQQMFFRAFVTEWDWGLPDVDYCPCNFTVLIEKCWATNAVDHPQFCIICQLSVAIFLKHPYGGEDVPPDYP